MFDNVALQWQLQVKREFHICSIFHFLSLRSERETWRS